MQQDRIHRTISIDGTEIVGRVCGQGPPVVFVHGSFADGESEWGELLPWLTGRFTCYLPSLRGRGRSGPHGDPSRETHVADITAFIDSIGEPVGLVGVSFGGMLALGAAARTPTVTTLVAREPLVFEVISAPDRAHLQHLVELAAEAVQQARPAEGVGAFFEWITNDDEAAALSEPDPEQLETLAAYLPIDLAEVREALESAGPSPTDPAVLERITAPVLLLHGSHTAQAWFTDSIRYAADHLPNATVREIPGAGHLGQLARPQRDADELIPFLEAAHQPV